MKKLVGIVLLCLMAAALYAVPPMPGSHTTHDGSQLPEINPVPFRSPSRHNADSSLQKISPLSTAASGDRNLLIILVNYDDLKFSILGAGATDEDYKNHYLDLLQNNTYSMRKYYQDMSGGQLNLTFTVLGPYNLDHNKTYYGENTEKSDGKKDDKPGNLIHDAISKALDAGHLNAELWANYADNWDYNNDGEIDTIFVIHAGIGEEEGTDTDAIFSQQWNLNSAKKSGRSDYAARSVEFGGKEKTFSSYTIEPEYNSSGAVKGASIGVFCHEYGHILGLMDLYDTTYVTNGVGYWCLMSFGNWGSFGAGNTVPGADPAPLLAWEKYYLGWLNPVTITPTAEPQTFYFSDIESSRKTWKIPLNPSGSQYLMLEGKKENSTGTGWYVQEDGLLITHINEDILSKYWGNNINISKTRVHGVDIVESESPYYETTGLGNLWNEPFFMSGIVCFRNNTKSILVPSYPKAAAGIGLFVSLLLLHRKRKKLGLMLLICCLACITACDDVEIFNSSDSGDDNGGIVIPDGDTGFHYVKGQDIPNTNYYESEDITSKTGISGVIITVNCPAGSSSGSFTVMKEK